MAVVHTLDASVIVTAFLQTSVISTQASVYWASSLSVGCRLSNPLC
jgi:hypothetical protein